MDLEIPKTEYRLAPERVAPWRYLTGEALSLGAVAIGLRALLNKSGPHPDHGVIYGLSMVPLGVFCAVWLGRMWWIGSRRSGQAFGLEGGGVLVLTMFPWPRRKRVLPGEVVSGFIRTNASGARDMRLTLCDGTVLSPPIGGVAVTPDEMAAWIRAHLGVTIDVSVERSR